MAALTAAGGRTGFEAALGAKAGSQTAVKEAAQGYWKNLLRNVPKHALADIPQELPDELFSQLSSALATNPKADIGQVVGDFIQRSPELMGAVALMGGAGGAGGAMKAQQDARSSPGQAQTESARVQQGGDDAGGQQSSSGGEIPQNTTSGDGKPLTQPSTPPLSVADSQKLIDNVSKMPPEAQQHPQVQADLEQARKVVAEDAASKAQPSTPPLSVADSQKLIENVSKMPPEAQRHSQVQADLEQAKKVLQDHVQQLESQKEPLSEAQMKELADAKAALERLRTPLPGQQHISGGRPELPEGAKLFAILRALVHL
ncbi:hypothetical protein [Prosthecobacter vanneervenii]|uniref:Exonuclease VII small subunit n=1 Tax=Prosthecobacter vanneervenii TaxID=48466 RepID=A0A7W7YFV9_9BACT|nr:hypothetical protein [Prosthecobacter vanneervenii]MBB5035453.1 exonuclease VII small subunit [Prosthecobacter vanneervenii]